MRSPGNRGSVANGSPLTGPGYNHSHSYLTPFLFLRWRAFISKKNQDSLLVLKLLSRESLLFLILIQFSHAVWSNTMVVSGTMLINVYQTRSLVWFKTNKAMYQQGQSLFPHVYYLSFPHFIRCSVFSGSHFLFPWGTNKLTADVSHLSIACIICSIVIFDSYFFLSDKLLWVTLECCGWGIQDIFPAASYQTPEKWLWHWDMTPLRQMRKYKWSEMNHLSLWLHEPPTAIQYITEYLQVVCSIQHSKHSSTEHQNSRNGLNNYRRTVVPWSLCPHQSVNGFLHA